MTRLVVIRHGETNSKENDVLKGRKDVELNKRGKKQAEKLARRMENELETDIVYSSDLKRAHKTAEKIVEKTDSEHTKREELRERNWGHFEGRCSKDRRNVLENGDKLDRWRPDGGENLEDIRSRIKPLLEEIEEKHQDETVVIVAHAWVNRAIIMELLEAEGRGHSIKQSNTALNILEKEDFRGWRLSKINDIQHLE